MPSTTDLVSGIDPTGFISITGAQLLTLVANGTPYTDKGLTILTTDDGSGNPDVPNAATTTKWKRYIWIRQSATATIPYVWNDNASSNATYLKWQTIAAASIGIGTITNAMIADNTIQDVKIANLSYSKLTGAPTGLPPSGAATGDLTGTYPSPSIAANAITTSKIADASITNSKLEAGVVGVSGIDLVAKVKVPAVAYVIPRVNSGATALEYVATTAVGRVLQIQTVELTTKVDSSGNLASLTAAPNANATGMVAIADTTGLSGGGFTPLSASSILFIEVIAPVGVTTGGGAGTFTGYTFVGLYTGTGAVAPLSGGAFGNNTSISITSAGTVSFCYQVASGSTALRNYYARFGASGASTAHINSIDGTNVIFGTSRFTLKITEIL